jgi:hypothetical protein
VVLAHIHTRSLVRFTDLLADPPGLVSGRRPSPEQLAALKARRDRKAALTEHMPGDAQQVLKRVNALSKTLKKMTPPPPAPPRAADDGSGERGAGVEAATNTADMTEEEELALAIKLSMSQ